MAPEEDGYETTYPACHLSHCHTLPLAFFMKYPFSRPTANSLLSCPMYGLIHTHIWESSTATAPVQKGKVREYLQTSLLLHCCNLSLRIGKNAFVELEIAPLEALHPEAIEVENRQGDFPVPRRSIAVQDPRAAGRTTDLPFIPSNKWSTVSLSWLVGGLVVNHSPIVHAGTSAGIPVMTPYVWMISLGVEPYINIMEMDSPGAVMFTRVVCLDCIS